jgi:MFS family permease
MLLRYVYEDTFFASSQSQANARQIFKGLGLSGNTTSLLASGVVGIVMWFATMPAVAYVDKLGRKPILIVGAIGMATCHIIIAVIFAKNENQWETHKGAGWAAVVMVWLFVVHFGYSWGPCAWIIIAEIWPLSQRPYGIALGGKFPGLCTHQMKLQLTHDSFFQLDEQLHHRPSHARHARAPEIRNCMGLLTIRTSH